jgi:hypothetical protein
MDKKGVGFIAVLISGILAITLAACGGGGGGGTTPPAPNISVSDSVDPNSDLLVPFGTVTLDSTSDQTVTVTNTGTANLAIGAVASANPLGEPFSITTDTCSGQTIAPAGNCTLTVRFAPVGTGSFADSFDIPSNDPDTATVTVSVDGTGSATPVPNITVTDSVAPDNDLQMPFGNVTIGSTSDQTVTVTNTGTADLIIGSVATANLLEAPFSITADTCSGQTIVPSAACTVAVRFAPSGTGSFADSFDIPSNDPDTSSITVVVTGMVPEPNIFVTDSVNPNNDLQLPFGSVPQGGSADQTVTVTNTGNANLVIGTVASSNPLAAPFSITADTCSGQTIVPSGTCTVAVRFSPTGNGSFSDSFSIPSNDPDTSTVTVSVSGTGTATPVPNITVTDSVAPDNDLQMPFGNVTIGSTSDQTVTVTNTGTADLIMGTPAPFATPFGIASQNCWGQTIAPNGSCSVTIRFAPSAATSYTSSYTISSNDPDTPTVTVSMSGTGAAASTPAPSISLPKTGQTATYAAGDDGSLQKGVAWPSPRFTNADGTPPVTGNVVLDQLTGLMWLKNANCMATSYPSFDADGTAGNGAVTWQHALDFVAGINAGTYANCGGGYSDWRLPNGRELRSLIDYSRFNPSLPSGNPFTNVQANYYWTSTSNGLGAYVVLLSQGNFIASDKAVQQYVWPVRAGQ